MKNTTYTETDLGKMTTSELLAIHNKHAKAAGAPLVKRFASKPVAIRRAWSVVELAQERAAAAVAAKPKATPTKGKAKTLAAAPKSAAKAAASKTSPAPKRSKQIQAGELGDRRQGGLIQALHAIVAKAGTMDREELIERALVEYSPPRSGTYNRTFVLGYVAHALNRGYLVEASA